MRRPARRVIRAAALLALACPLAAAPAAAGTTTFAVDAPTLQSLLRAVTPYDIVIGQGGLSETLTLSNPRDVRFQNGKIRLRLDCRGTPFPLEEVLEPAITVRYNEAKRAWEMKVEELPLKVGMLGTVDLADYVRPVKIPSEFSQPAGEGPESLTIDGRILGLKVLDAKIEVTADVTFRPGPRPTASVPATSPGSSRPR